MSKEAADQSMLLATDVIKNSPSFKDYSGKYLILYDQALAKIKFDNMNRAVNVAAKQGWKPIEMSTMFDSDGFAARYMFVMMERVEKGP